MESRADKAVSEGGPPPETRLSDYAAGVSAEGLMSDEISLGAWETAQTYRARTFHVPDPNQIPSGPWCFSSTVRSVTRIRSSR